MEKEIYESSPLEILTNEFWKLQRLQDEGQNVSSLLEETWDKITEIIHQEDKERLKSLRERIKDIIKEENEQGKRTNY